MLSKFNTEESGVSPVIGVILLVAVTVALVALATVIVFDIGSDVSDTADASVTTDVDGDEVSAQVVRNDNVAEFYLLDEGDDVDGIGEESDQRGDDVGDRMTFDSGGDSGTASVVVVLDDGTQEVLTTFDY